MKILSIAMIVLLSAASSTNAQRLDPAHVGEGAKWLVHVNFDAVRQTTIAQQFRDDVFADPRAQELQRMSQERYGIDLREDLHALTMYGDNYERNRGVAILWADFDRDKVQAIVRGEAGYETTTHRDYTLHSWIMGESGPGAQREQRVFAALYGDDAVVFAADAAEARAALDILDGERPSLKDRNEASPLLEDISQGTIFYGAAIELGTLRQRDRDQFPILQLGRKIRIAVGEDNEQVFARARLEAQSPDVARQVKSMAEGLRAMLELQAEGREDVPRALKDVRVSADEAIVTVQWHAKSQEVIRMLQNMLEQRQGAEAPVKEPAQP